MKNKIPIRLIIAFAVCVTMLSLLSLTVSADCAHNYVRVYQMENASMHSYKSQCIYCGTVTEGWGYSGWLDHNFNSYGTCVDCGYYQAPACAHYYANTVYQYENDSMHSYYGVCTSCGQRLEGIGYSGWSNHSFMGNTCTQCGFIKSCSHFNSVPHYNNLGTYHSRYMYCNDCGISHSTVTEAHAWNYGPCTSISDSSHSRTLTCVCGAMDSQSEMHYFSGNTCTSCGFQKPVVNATVSLSAYSSSGTLGSSGGEISSEVIPASYTVTASAGGCTVTQIVYVQNGRTYTTPGNSVTITANSESEFTTTSFTAQTDAGVTAAFTVNHKFVKKNTAQIMWETSHTATIRSIVGNGLNKTLSHTMEIPNSYDSQTNLTAARSAEIQSLIGRDDGQTYVVNYTRVITVYTPAEYSSTGQKVIRGTYDGNSLAEIEECISKYGWTAQTQTAIRQAASSSLSFTTGKMVDCTAVWIDTTSYEQIYTKAFGTSVSTYNTSSVSVSYSEFPNSTNYVYESLTYSGDTVGNSDSTTYSQTCTATSRPLTVTFYCHPVTVTPPETTHGSVTVVVRDYDTGDPIMGASVSGAGLSKTTGSSGRALFGYIELGGYTFTASKSGYTSGSSTATITATQPAATVTIYLDKQPTDGIIVVNVRYKSTNALLSGALIEGGGRSGTTGDAGSIAFINMPFGSYTFTASKSGYNSGTATAAISVSQTTTTVTIHLEKLPTSGSITVTVRDKSTNALISGATVTSGGLSGTTPSTGKVTFTNVPFGSYTFTASKYGYTPSSATAVISVSSTTASVTIYLEENLADVGITANTVNGTVYRGSKIMVAATVRGDAETDFTPTNPLTVTMQMSYADGTLIDTHVKSVICPKSETNLVWFAVTVPETGFTSPNLKFMFNVTMPDGLNESNTSDNTSTRTVTTYVLPDRQSPDADFELNAPSSFTNSPYRTTTATTRTWSVWEWSSGFVKRNYSARLTTAAKLTPDATAVWQQHDSLGNYTTRSGYGLNTEVDVSLSGISSTMFTGNAKVNAYYPEHNYSESDNLSDMLDKVSENASGYTATYTFKPDSASISGGKMHKTPIWFPDGDYSVKYYVYDLWTPAGMLTANTYAKVAINGSMYDDYYTQRN